MKKFTTIIVIYFYSMYSFAGQKDLGRNIKYNVNSASEFIFESYPNQELIPIRLLGAIKNAGLYHIPPDMKLMTLLSLAGGTTSEADIENIIIGNDQQLKHNKSLTINLEKNLIDGGMSDYTLIPNDIILIKNKTPLISNDSFRVISIISILLTSVLTAIIINDKYIKDNK